MLQIFKGIKALHDNSISHRDLKPDNILYKLDKGEIIYKISDFGLAVE